jgi:threonylcarbamoyladenosine tRNA methylthiotransferase MtaB
MLQGRYTFINTCAVTAEATPQARQSIRRIAREKQGARIVVTGCAAQVEPEAFAAMSEVAKVLGNHEKMQAETWGSLRDFGVGLSEKVLVNDIMAVKETAMHLIDGMRGLGYELRV